MKRLILWLWALYFAAACLTNGLDLLRGIGVLPSGWRYVSGNLQLLARTLDEVGLPTGLAVLLLVCVVLWQGAATWLFWRALTRPGWVERAFIAGAGLWAAFLLADELLLSYGLEAVHLRLFIGQTVSYLVMRFSGNA